MPTKTLSPRTSFGVAHPELVTHWSWEENPGVDPYALSSGSGYKAVWRCPEHGHRQVKPINKKVSFPICGICNGKVLLSGFSDLFTRRPEIACFWDYLLNECIPQEVTAGSGLEFLWKCPNGEAHSYLMSVHERCLAEKRCPYCNGYRILIGFNDFASVEPEIAAEWDYERNTISPCEVTRTSGKKVFWICPEGHPYDARISDRVLKGSGCSVCKGKSVLVGVNDLNTLFPAIAAEVHPNSPFKATEVTAGSNKTLQWLCGECDHDWYTQVSERTGPHATGCPHCNGRVPISGLDDLETLFPHIAAEMDSDRNGGLLPSQLLPLSNRYVYWLCVNNHSVRTQVSSRVRHWGCRKCSISKIEQLLANGLEKEKHVPFLERTHPLDVAWRTQKKAIVDIYVELANGIKVVIEYDGVWWHRAKQVQDIAKTEGLLAAGYTVIRIREHTLEHLELSHPNLYQFNHGTSKSTQPETLIPKVALMLASL